MSSDTTKIAAVDEPLRSKTIRGTAWSVVEMFGSGALRFVSSLVLTRLLFPEAFGLVVTASILLIALELFSDLGLTQGIIQHRRGGDPRYLNTAWTLQVARSFLLAGIAVAAAYPFASFYQEPILAPILLVTALSLLLRGFSSPALFLLKRNMKLRRLAIMELLCQVIRISGTIVAALMLRNVWALVLGGLLGQTCRLVGSYLIWPYRPRPRFDVAAARELARFGSFILLSGILGFAATRLDVILVPKYLGMGSAGVYAIAVNIAMMLNMLIDKIADLALYPAFCQLRDDVERLRARQQEVLRLYCALVVPSVWVLAANADLLINLMYDARYAGAGIVLRWLLVAVVIQGGARLTNLPIMATGRSYVGTIASLGFLIGLCVTLPLLAPRWGTQGYAAAKMLGSLGLLFPLLWFACKLGYRTVGDLLQHVWVPLVTLVALSGIDLVCRTLDDALICQIVRPAGGVLVLTLVLFVWQREVLMSTLQGFFKLVPGFGGDSKVK